MTKAHRSDDWTIEDMVRVAHRHSMRVEFITRPMTTHSVRDERKARWRLGCRKLTPTDLSLIQRGFRLGGRPLRLAHTPYLSWRRAVFMGRDLARGHAALRGLS